MATETEALQPASDSYNPVHFGPLAAIEDRHFWFVTRRRLLARLLRRFTAGLAPGYRVLEVGCGGGNVLTKLREACPQGAVYGMDAFGEGLAHAARRGNRLLVQGDAHRPPFRSQFDIVGAFDVVEHLAEDTRILGDFYVLLRPGGYLLLTVPAHAWLWSEFDEISCHCRRYSRRELENKLIAAGFGIEFLSPYMACTLPLVWAHRTLGRRNRERQSSQERGMKLIENEIRILPVINSLLTWALRLENRLLERLIPLPFGTSLLAVARKK